MVRYNGTIVRASLLLNLLMAGWIAIHLLAGENTSMLTSFAEYNRFFLDATAVATTSNQQKTILVETTRNTFSAEEDGKEERTPFGGVSWSRKKKSRSSTSSATGSSSATRMPDREVGIQLNRQRNITNSDEQDLLLGIRGVSGMGHRLSRLAGAFHMAKAINHSRLTASWGWECGINSNGDPDIFDNLFGKGPLIVKPTPPNRPVFPNLSVVRTAAQNSTNKRIIIINNIPGYEIAELRSPSMNTTKHHFYDKLASDFEFYSQLLVLFRFHEQVRDFMRLHEFDKHTIVGFHVRTGNGEKGDFVKKHRGIVDVDDWVQNAASLLRTFSQNLTKPAKIFLATDTPGLAKQLANATRSLPVIVVDQERPEAGTGVSYVEGWNKKEECHNGWVSQFTDIALLSLSDVVIAGRYSSFTQSMPLVMMLGSRAAATDMKMNGLNKMSTNDGKDEEYLRSRFDPRNPSNVFCEMGKAANGMRCYDDFFEWEAHGKNTAFGSPADDFSRQNHILAPRVDVLDIFERLFNGTVLDVRVANK